MQTGNLQMLSLLWFRPTPVAAGVWRNQIFKVRDGRAVDR